MIEKKTKKKINMSVPQQIRFVFSGGGMRGVSYIGFLCALQCHQNSADSTEKPELQELDFRSPGRRVCSFCGTSVGALIAVLCFLRADFACEPTFRLIDQMIRACKVVDSIPLLGMLFSNNGSGTSLNSGVSVKAFLTQTIKTLTQLDNPTMHELSVFVNASNTKSHADQLVLCATNTDTKKAEYFSAETRPDLKVVDAIFASMCVPLMFEPQLVGNRHYVDGGLSDNTPFAFDMLQRFKARSLPIRCLVFRVRSVRSVHTPRNPRKPRKPGFGHLGATVVSAAVNLFRFQREVLQVLNSVWPVMHLIAVDIPSSVFPFAFDTRFVSELLDTGQEHFARYFCGPQKKGTEPVSESL
jgi:predicted acylesterase/phospholipase RssA